MDLLVSNESEVFPEKLCSKDSRFFTQLVWRADTNCACKQPSASLVYFLPFRSTNGLVPLDVFELSPEQRTFHVPWADERCVPVPVVVVR
jgi:hypothetical protein